MMPRIDYSIFHCSPRSDIQDEASKLQLKVKALSDLNSRFTQLLRHVRIRMYGGRESVAGNVNLENKDVQVLRDVIIRELLIERDGNDRRFELTRKIFELKKSGDERNDREAVPIERSLRDHGFSVKRAEIEEIESLVAKEAKRRFESELDSLEVSNP